MDHAGARSGATSRDGPSVGQVRKKDSENGNEGEQLDVPKPRKADTLKGGII